MADKTHIGAEASFVVETVAAVTTGTPTPAVNTDFCATNISFKENRTSKDNTTTCDAYQLPSGKWTVRGNKREVKREGTFTMTAFLYVEAGRNPYTAFGSEVLKNLKIKCFDEALVEYGIFCEEAGIDSFEPTPGGMEDVQVFNISGYTKGVYIIGDVTNLPAP